MSTHDKGAPEREPHSAHNLRSTADAAKAWGVSRQRAHVHVVRLHRVHGVGVQLGGRWLLTTEEIEKNRPNPLYRRKAGENA